MSSIHAQYNEWSTTYRVFWRHDGKQRTLSFPDRPAAEAFKALLDTRGLDEALRAITFEEARP